MVRTRRQRQEAAPQAQDYTYGWRDVPAPVRLDKICCYLDAASMGILEICGKNCLGDAQRAWQAKAAGARGTLGDLSTKQFVRAQTRTRALMPRYLGGTGHFGFNEFKPVSFDDFAFTVVVSWCPSGGGIGSAEFPFMRLVRGEDEQGEFNMSRFAFFPPAGADHEALSACLRRVSQASLEDGSARNEVNDLTPEAVMVCTRKSDGAATRVSTFTEWTSLHDFAPGDNQGSLSFDSGRLLVQDEDDERFEMTLHMIWDAASGRVRAFGCHLYVNGQHAYDDFPEETFLALLRARLDESVRN